ncbi:MAG: hypothetical protein ACSHX0_14035 [Akkermansiaceae bacterium]
MKHTMIYNPADVPSWTNNMIQNAAKARGLTPEQVIIQCLIMMQPKQLESFLLKPNLEKMAEVKAKAAKSDESETAGAGEAQSSDSSSAT